MPPTPRHAAQSIEGESGTKDRLLNAAAQVVRNRGIGGASARVIATQAGVNQALIFYHFNTVSELVETSSNRAVDRALDRYRSALDSAATFGDLLTVARHLHGRERAMGNVAFMAQIVSGAGHDPAIARAARYAVTAWTGQVRAALHRVTRDSAVADLIDIAGFAPLVTAGFIGIELYGSVDPQSAADARSALDGLGHIADALGKTGPVTRRALRIATRRE